MCCTQRRHVLIEEAVGGRIELIASGKIDESHLEAIEGFVRRQRIRLNEKPVPTLETQ